MTYDQWMVQDYALLLAKKEEFEHDIKALIKWWWENHQRDFYDYGAGDDLWFQLAEKYGIDLQPPVSAVEAMHNRWEEPYE